MAHWYFHGLSRPGTVVASARRPRPKSRPICHSLSTGRSQRISPVPSTEAASSAEFCTDRDHETS